ncbi:MAG TPA: alpha/beta hydrolase [Candidatus Limnocylindria bacterium]
MPLTRALTFTTTHGAFLHAAARGMALLVSTLLALGSVSPAPAAAMDSAEFTQGAGVYQLESGQHLTLFGRHPMLELDGEEIHLSPDGHDRYRADSEPFETITFIRDADGAVTAVGFERPGREPEVAPRVDLFQEREVTFDSGNVRLAGSLFLPSGAGPHPALAMVHGAGPHNRETYRLLASSLARAGVAALIYDKRGTGESAGDFASATFDDLTDDALAAHALVRAEPTVDDARVGLAGASQGAWIIASAAVRNDDVAFLVAVSPSGFNPGDAADWLTGSMLAVRGFSPHAIATSTRAWQMMYSSLDLIEAGVMEPMPGVPGFWFHALDPRLETVGLWEQVRQPVLGLWGELDCQVPARDSLTALRAALERGPNRAYRLEIFAGTDHSMVLAGPCEREISAGHGGRRHYADGYLTTPAEWIHGLDRADGEGLTSVPAQVPESGLGWHQSGTMSVGWFGSLVPQLALPGLLLALFGGIVAATGVRKVLGLGRRRGDGEPASAGLWVASAISGGLATLVGLTALAEMLILGGVRGAPLLGDGPVLGVTAVHLLAGLLVLVTIVVAAMAIRASARTGRLLSMRSAAGTVAVATLAIWAGYWGFLPPVGLG